MKTYTIQSNNLVDFDKQINDFEEEEVVKATQTSHLLDKDGEIQHFATLFYVAKKKDEKPKIVSYTVKTED